MKNVWVLKGGLGGWLRAGYSTEPASTPAWASHLAEQSSRD
jgi:3-mercaptopyruvate sulfurtransferase SseA